MPKKKTRSTPTTKPMQRAPFPPRPAGDRLDLSDAEYWTPARLERAYKRVEGRWLGDHRIVRAGGDAHGNALWAVERRSNGGAR